MNNLEQSLDAWTSGLLPKYREPTMNELRRAIIVSLAIRFVASVVFGLFNNIAQIWMDRSNIQ